MKDKNGQTVEVQKEWHRATQVRIVINAGRPDERDVLLDSVGARELVKDILDAL